MHDHDLNHHERHELRRAREEARGGVGGGAGFRDGVAATRQAELVREKQERL